MCCFILHLICDALVQKFSQRCRKDESLYLKVSSHPAHFICPFKFPKSLWKLALVRIFVLCGKETWVCGHN